MSNLFDIGDHVEEGFTAIRTGVVTEPPVYEQGWLVGVRWDGSDTTERIDMAALRLAGYGPLNELIRRRVA